MSKYFAYDNEPAVSGVSGSPAGSLLEPGGVSDATLRETAGGIVCPFCPPCYSD